MMSPEYESDVIRPGELDMTGRPIETRPLPFDEAMMAAHPDGYEIEDEEIEDQDSLTMEDDASGLLGVTLAALREARGLLSPSWQTVKPEDLIVLATFILDPSTGYSFMPTRLTGMTISRMDLTSDNDDDPVDDLQEGESVS